MCRSKSVDRPKVLPHRAHRARLPGTSVWTLVLMTAGVPILARVVLVFAEAMGSMLATVKDTMPLVGRGRLVNDGKVCSATGRVISSPGTNGDTTRPGPWRCSLPNKSESWMIISDCKCCPAMVSSYSSVKEPLTE